MGKKPNVLIILADQYRYDCICEAGYPHMITPNLDRLAREGCLYTCAHSSNPVCMPARHDLLTGVTAKYHGYFNNSKNPIKDYGLETIPRIFSENGYRTASIGKMHFCPARAHHGYNQRYTMEEIPKYKEDDDYAMYLKEHGDGSVQNIHGVRPVLYHTPQKALVSEENYETNWVAEQTIHWLEENNSNPFMLFVGYIKPHPPWNIPKKYEGIYKDRELPSAIKRSRCYPEVNTMNQWYGDSDTEEQQRKIREAYYTSCTMVDESIGKILTYLKEQGTLDNTLVIFTSDHGEMLNDKGFYSKNLPYESSVRVPLIMRYPERIPMGMKSDCLADLLDLFPTCLDACHLNYPKNAIPLYGVSLLDKDTNKEIVFSSNGFPGVTRWVMARTKEYKYIYHYNQGFEELYDLKNDPKELNNCIEQMHESEIYHYLYAQAVNYETLHGPEGLVKDGAFICFEGTLNTGYEHGKYHLWSNKQFQRFLRESKDEYGAHFLKELKEAISEEAISGKQGKQPRIDDLWIQTFKESFEGLSNEKDFIDTIFKQQGE